MEVARWLISSTSKRIVSAWLAFVMVAGDFLDEATFRVGLAFDVLVGRKPIETHKRPWLRSAETPTLIDVFDWTTDRLLFSVLVWPSLESSRREAGYVQRDRVEEVTGAIAKGAREKMWTTYWEIDYGLQWDRSRGCWRDGDGHYYDGSRFAHLRHGSREPTNAA